MFFITTDMGLQLERLFLKVFDFPPSAGSGEKHKAFVKGQGFQALFYGCRREELAEHVVFVSGRAFPAKNTALKPVLERIVQKRGARGLLHGNFNLIVFPKGQGGSFFLISDRHGSIPCFLSRGGGAIHISSVPHLMLLAGENRLFNEESLLDYLCLGYVLPGKSLWRAMEALPKDEILTVQSRAAGDGGPQISPQISREKVNSEEERALPPFQRLEDAAEALFESLKETAASQLKLPDADSMLLSGGSDTRLLLAAMSREQRESLFYKTYQRPVWSSSDNDLLAAKAIVRAEGLRHQIIPPPAAAKAESAPQAAKETKYFARLGRPLCIGGQFGSELFGGAAFCDSLDLDYCYSERQDFLKAKLFQFTSREAFKKTGSPWARLNRAVLSLNFPSREAAFMQKMLLQSQFTSIYSRENVHAFIFPARHHFCSGKLLPYIDGRVLDVYLRCPREFLLNYSLYRHIFAHLAERRLSEIPFQSNMLRFADELPKAAPDSGEVIKNAGAKAEFNYGEYFARCFSPALFEGTFLEGAAAAGPGQIREPFLSRICDLTAFLLGLEGGRGP